jgi:hypothetical protein
MSQPFKVDFSSDAHRRGAYPHGKLTSPLCDSCGQVLHFYAASEMELREKSCLLDRWACVNTKCTRAFYAVRFGDERPYATPTNLPTVYERMEGIKP